MTASFLTVLSFLVDLNITIVYIFYSYWILNSFNCVASISAMISAIITFYITYLKKKVYADYRWLAVISNNLMPASFSNSPETSSVFLETPALLYFG